jgi:hypothetical protein
MTRIVTTSNADNVHDGCGIKKMQADYGGMRGKEVRENVCSYIRNIEPTNPIEHNSSSQTHSHFMTVFTVAKKCGWEKREKKTTGSNYSQIREALAYVSRGRVLLLISLQKTSPFHI